MPAPLSRSNVSAVRTTPARAKPPAAAQPAPRPDSFGAAQAPAVTTKRLVDGLLAKPPSITAERVVDELKSPRGWALLRELSERVGERPAALVPLMLAVPEKWGHLESRALLAATRFDPGPQGQVLDVLVGLATRGGTEQRDWAAHQLTERELQQPTGRLAALAAERSPAVLGALKAQLGSELAVPAAKVLLQAGVALPRKAAERLGEALGASFGPRSTIDALVKQAAAGDSGALTALRIAAEQSPDAQRAARDAFDAAQLEPVRAALAPMLKGWTDGLGEEDLERAMRGARLGEPAALKALVQQLELSTTAQTGRQQKAAAVLAELAQANVPGARAALLSVKPGFSTSAGVLRLMAGAVRTPKEAAALLDGLETPLRFGSPEVSRAATDVLKTLGAPLEPRHEDWLLDALRAQSLRAAVEHPPGDVPAAATLVARLGVGGGLRDKLIARLDPYTSLGIAKVFEQVTMPTSAELAALGRAFNDAGPGPGHDALGAVLLKHGALDALATPAFRTLSGAQREQVVTLALERGDEGLRARLLEQLPDSGVTGRLEELGAEYRSALVTAVKAAPEGSDLWKLGQNMGALQLAEQPEYRGRIDTAKVRAQLTGLTQGPLAPTLEALRERVRAPVASLVDAQAKYLESPELGLRARLLPPAERDAFLKRNLSALSALAPEKSRALAVARFARLPEAAQDALLDAMRAAGQLGELGSNAELRVQLAQTAKLLVEPAGKLAAGAEHLGKLKGGLAAALEKASFGLSLLALDPADGWSVADAAKDLAGLALPVAEGAAHAAGRALLGKTLGAAGGALNLYDAVKAGVQATEEFGNGDTVGGVARIGSGAGSLGMAAGVALAASNPVGWTVLAVSAGVWLGSELVDLAFGESDTDTRLRQLGVLLP